MLVVAQKGKLVHSTVHLFPIIKAIVIKRNSLPSFPRTDGLNFFRREMKSKASRMTFWLTCVVDKMVVTHFRKPIVGIASGTRAGTDPPEFVNASIASTFDDFSNQKRQVICKALGVLLRG